MLVTCSIPGRKLVTMETIDTAFRGGLSVDIVETCKVRLMIFSDKGQCEQEGKVDEF